MLRKTYSSDNEDTEDPFNDAFSISMGPQSADTNNTFTKISVAGRDEIAESSSDKGSGARGHKNKVDNDTGISESEMRNIWPTLVTLNMSLSAAGGNSTVGDHTDVIEKLSEQFSYSPRRFTETLVTIMEDSFLHQPEDISDDELKFLQGILGVATKQLDDESAPDLMQQTPSCDSLDSASALAPSSSRSNADTSAGDGSTTYKAIQRRATPGKFRKTHRRSIKIFLQRATPEGASPRVSPASTDDTLKKRRTPGKSMSHQLRIGSSSDGGSQKSPGGRKQKTYPNIPKIVVAAVSPIVRESDRRRVDLLSSESDNDDGDDDEYLTAAESDKDMFETTTEPVAASSRKTDMSMIAQRHREWVEAFEKVSVRKLKQSSREVEAKQSVGEHRNRLMQRQFRELQLKRQRCFDLVDQVMEMAHPSAEDRKSVFWDTLRACSEYFDCGRKTMTWPSVPSVAPSAAPSRPRYVSSAVVNLQRKSRSPRRSLVKPIAKAKSPAAGKVLGVVVKKNPTTTPKRRSLHRPKTPTAPKSPAIDKVSIRPVAELRRIFSPNLRTADARPQTASSVRQQILGGRRRDRFRHVKSPIREYIAGNRQLDNNPRQAKSPSEALPVVVTGANN